MLSKKGNIMSKKKRKTFRYFESSDIKNGFQEPYISITKSMLTSEKWKSLNYASKEIYLQMKLWSYGREEFKFSYSLALNVVKSRSTFKKAIDELTTNGFIEIIRISRTPGIGTIYKFSDKWYL